MFRPLTISCGRNPGARGPSLMLVSGSMSSEALSVLNEGPARRSVYPNPPNGIPFVFLPAEGNRSQRSAFLLGTPLAHPRNRTDRFVGQNIQIWSSGRVSHGSMLRGVRKRVPACHGVPFHRGPAIQATGDPRPWDGGGGDSPRRGHRRTHLWNHWRRIRVPGSHGCPGRRPLLAPLPDRRERRARARLVELLLGLGERRM